MIGPGGVSFSNSIPGFHPGQLLQTHDRNNLGQCSVARFSAPLLSIGAQSVCAMRCALMMMVT